MDKLKNFAYNRIYNQEEVSKIVILLSVLLGATIMDCISFKIKNRYLLISFFISVSYQIYSNDFQVLLPVFIRIFLTFVLLYPIYLIKGIGAGDVKLFLIISIFFSFEEMPWVIFIAFLIGAAEGTFLLAGSLLQKYRREAQLIFFMQDLMSQLREKNTHIHFTIPITISVLLKIGGIY